MTKTLHGGRKEYILSSFNETTVNADPLKQFSNWFEEANRAGIGETNAMVLSTSDIHGNVSARVVLLKGIEKNGFIFFTNYDSSKGLQLLSNPKAALTFFWSPLERQIRVEGKVVKIPRKESKAYFETRPPDSRVSACVSPQSCVIPDRFFLESMRDGLMLDLEGQPPRCPDNWGGYLLKPTMIEFWQGRAHRLHDRLRYRLTGKTWIVERLAP
ncbi:MAG: pyridoxamine 5'-phosphate oxidase [Bacteroidales bacterium]|nr:pyridoxamine 5'-phosphate oxidase [Bacteroidales bacterium]